MSYGHEYVGGTHGSGIVSSAADLLGISVLRGIRGVGVVCEMYMCLAVGGAGGEEGEWIRGLGLGFANPVEIVLDVCLGCGYCGWWGLVAPYRYLHHTVYLFVANIANPDLFAYGPGFVSTSPTFMSCSASHPA